MDPASTEVRVVIGNHDVGFHYAVTPFLENRFERAFDVSSVDRFLQLRSNRVTPAPVIG